ncbi:hypothetical protein BAE44_0020819 [Dichanthelium oligosanthes]|uniref:Uncharacterized protein n=1 Tax=Dichanthelium oligosanthes TaxID=888268 RepID=A0A1E5UZ31_9POAL|nr:hypothetical protein BAE44_0020819 [Dichanthelium oligosanthes]
MSMDNFGKAMEDAEIGGEEVIGNEAMPKVGDSTAPVDGAMVVMADGSNPEGIEDEEFDFDRTEGLDEGMRRWFVMASRPSEIVIHSIDLWVRFYDVPATLMTKAFANVLAKKAAFSATRDGGGEEKEKVVDGAAMMEEDAKLDATPKKVPQEVSNALAQIVQNMMVGDVLPDLNVRVESGLKEKVSGLESFVDSSERTTSEVAPALHKEEEKAPRSIHERLHAAKAARAGQLMDKKLGFKGPSPVKEIGKQ